MVVTLITHSLSRDYCASVNVHVLVIVIIQILFIWSLLMCKTNEALTSCFGWYRHLIPKRNELLQWPGIRCLSILGMLLLPGKWSVPYQTLLTSDLSPDSIQIVLKFKGHEIWALVCFQEYRYTSLVNTSSGPKLHTRDIWLFLLP